MARMGYKELQSRTSKLPPGAAIAFSTRAAMRTLALIASCPNFKHWPEGVRPKHLQALLSCYQTSAFISVLINERHAELQNTTSVVIADANIVARAAAVAATTAASAANDAAKVASDAEDGIRAGDVYGIHVEDAIRAGLLGSVAFAAKDAANAAADAAATTNAARVPFSHVDAAATAYQAIFRYADLIVGTAAVCAVARFLVDPAAKAAAVRAFEDAWERDWNLGRDLCNQPLWPQGIPTEFGTLWQTFQTAAIALDAGFEVWLDWYQDRLDGKPLDFDIEREWALLSKEHRAQSPAEINAYLASLRGGLAR